MMRSSGKISAATYDEDHAHDAVSSIHYDEHHMDDDVI